MISRATLFGRFQIPEPEANLLSLHRHTGTALKEVDWEPKNAVLDQSDLEAQGIDTSILIPGAPKVDALGSCTANAFTSAFSVTATTQAYLAWSGAEGYDDTKALEEAAIRFYNGCTDQTGDPDTEWPPTDCGSSGPYVIEYATKLGLISGQKIAHGAQDLCSLLQTGPVLQGTPFLNAWMQPDANGFVDGNGSISTLETQIREGVAGGHETVIVSIVKLAVSATGLVEPHKTIFKVRNSWTHSWGDDGSFLIHASTLVALGGQCDFRQLVA